MRLRLIIILPFLGLRPSSGSQEEDIVRGPAQSIPRGIFAGWCQNSNAHRRNAQASATSSMRIQVGFPGGQRVDARVRGFTIATDQSPEQGGDASAPQPYDLFLSSIATCASSGSTIAWPRSTAGPPRTTSAAPSAR